MSKTDKNEVFIPTFELVMTRRNMLGEPAGGKVTYSVTSASKLASVFDMHRRKNPLARRDRRKREDAKV